MYTLYKQEIKYQTKTICNHNNTCPVHQIFYKKEFVKKSQSHLFLNKPNLTFHLGFDLFKLFLKL